MQELPLTAREPPGPAANRGSCENCYLKNSLHGVALTEAQRRAIVGLLRRRFVVEEGVVLVGPGQSRGLYTLYDGWAFEAVTLADGRRQIVNFAIPGDIIGMEGEAAPATRSVTTMSGAIVCEFAPDAIDLMLAADPVFSRHLLATALDRARNLENLAATLGRKRAIERVADIFVNIFRRSAAVNRVNYSGSISCVFPATHRILADATGLTPAHINSILRELREHHVAVLSGKVLTIHDLAALEEIAGSEAATPVSRLVL